MNDGPEEFVMEAQPSPEHLDQPSRIPTSDSRSSLEQYEHASNETDVEEEQQPQRLSQDLKHDIPAVMRRTHLPSPAVGDEGSLFAILKKNVGKVRISPILIIYTVDRFRAGFVHYHFPSHV